MCAHDARVRLLQGRVGQAELRRQVAAQVVEHGVRFGCQRMEHRPPLRMLEIERQALLVPVEGLEELAVRVAEEMRADVTTDVAAVLVVLDLDHLGAEVGEVRGAERPRAVLLDGVHAQAGERQLGGVGVHGWQRPRRQVIYTDNIAARGRLSTGARRARASPGPFALETARYRRCLPRYLRSAMR